MTCSDTSARIIANFSSILLRPNIASAILFIMVLPLNAEESDELVKVFVHSGAFDVRVKLKRVYAE